MNRLTLVLLFLIFAIGFSPVTEAQVATDQQATPWQYTFDDPGDGWHEPRFDTSDWHTGMGGFGTKGTPGAKIKTVWDSPQVWLRKKIRIDELPKNLALLVHHDEDAKVFLNGKFVTGFEGYTTEYEVVPLAQPAESVRPGDNLLAVHCKQTGGGQYIDVLVVDPEDLPKGYVQSPFDFTMITSWGADVTAENAWTEYPRPAMARDQWQNLNGRWDYAVKPQDVAAIPDQWDGKILVPYCLESKLSGVQRLLSPNEALWYRRSFTAAPRNGRRLKLNFEAVDYRCRVWVNGTEVGRHRGGNDPFSFDISDAVRAGENALVVRVEDETGGAQLRGKQTIKAGGIWYTRVSGIWQTVWLEEVPDVHIEDVKITSDAEQGSITIRPVIAGGAAGFVRVALKDESESHTAVGIFAKKTFTLDRPTLWSPDSPHLYQVEVSLLNENGFVTDSVTSYAGLRSVGKTRDADGHLRFTLNGKPIFHFGPLDQGWWPDGLLTPPSDEAMLSDIRYLKAAGFNMIRKHIKVEPRRYYYHCDRLGMMVWQDQVSGGANPKWTRLAPSPSDASWSDADHKQYLAEFDRMIGSLENHPSIVVWVPFNEAWGQHRTLDVGKWAAQRDPTRLINVASGGNFWPVGDVVDHHNYPHPDFPIGEDRYDDFIKVIGEFGGHGFPVKGHVWDETRGNWGYGGLPKDEQEYKQRYAESIRRLNDFRKRGIAGGVYTQTTDVEVEINGLMTYDRKVIKIPAEQLRKLHQPLYD